MAEKNSWAMETHETDIGAGLIDLPINNTLHLPKKMHLFACRPDSRPKHHKHPCDAQTNSVLHNHQNARHPSRQISHAGIAVLARASRQGNHITEASRSTGRQKDTPKWTRHTRAHVYMRT